MKKSKFWTFIFSFIPGGGQMYLGLMRKGLSIMFLFALVIAVASFLQLGFLFILLPVIWFYSFFDTMNLKAYTQEEIRAMDDRFIFDLDGMLKGDWKATLQKRHLLAGGICIFIGIYILFVNFINPILYRLDYVPDWVYTVIRQLPTLAIAVIIVCLGLYLIRGGKKKTEYVSPEEDDDDYLEYLGEEGDDDER